MPKAQLGKMGQYAMELDYRSKVNGNCESLMAEFRELLMTFRHPREYIKLASRNDARMVFYATSLRPNMTLCCGFWSALITKATEIKEVFHKIFGHGFDIYTLYKVHHDGNKFVVEQEMDLYKFPYSEVGLDGRFLIR